MICKDLFVKIDRKFSVQYVVIMKLGEQISSHKLSTIYSSDTIEYMTMT